MKHRMKSRMVFVFLAVLVSAALLGGCGKSDSGSIGPATASVLSAATPTAGLNTCAGCHTSTTTDWLTSKHANLDPTSDVFSSGVPTLGLIGGCTKNCHDPNGDSNNLTAGYTGNVPRPVIGCEACHGPGSLHADAGGTGPISLLSSTSGTTLGGAVPVSGQFVMCTYCHELLNTAGTGTVIAAHDTGGAEAASANGNQFIITDTHFATPGDWSGTGGVNTKPITGYAMDFSDEQVCTNCHNPHKPPVENREWAQSAHADKNYLNLNSTKTGYFSGAWAHYNWSQASRTACQRCHTTTGFVAYADALRSGNTQRALDINAGLVSLVTATTNFKPEMLKCNGCHTDNRGTLRNPGPITANYDYVSGGITYAKASHSYPDLAGSNVCMTCHVGREIGDTVKGLIDSALASAGTISIDFSNQSFINSHYLTAGGQVFTVTGYEFEGRPYNNIPEYRHDKIGTPATQQLSPYVNTGSNGPCIGCHMSRPNKNGNHLFLPVSRSTTTIGQVTGIASEVCFNCHGPSPTVILDMVNEEKQLFTGAMEALRDRLLSQRQYLFAPYSPYFYVAANGFNSSYVESGLCNQNLPIKNWQTGGTSAFVWDAVKKSCTSSAVTAGTAGTGKNNMGAAFNFNLLEHDPGAYVHNRMYVKRLIYDSIDWADDGIMNYSVGATLTALCAGGSPPAYCTEATTYLLPNGVLGIEAERP
jgi:hypothetical protein